MNGNRSRLHSFRPSSAARTRQVEDLDYVEENRDTGHYKHEEDEDGLLCGSRHVALHSEGTGGSGADDSGVHDKPVQIILAHNERYLQNESEKYGGHVVSQQVSFNLNMAFFVRVLGKFVDFTPRVSLHIFSDFIFFVDDVEDVTKVDQSRC